MEKKIPILLQEIIFGSSDSSISKKISKLKKEGKVKKIAPRLYTGNLEEDPETRMMNAELVSANQSKIMIPNVYREDYILSLRKLTRQHDAAPYIRMLSRAHEFSSNIYGSTMDKIQTKLESSNAFLLP